VLDPDLLGGLGTAELASGLLDTLCQGTEASWSIRSSDAAGAWGMAAVALAAPLLGRLAGGGLGQRERMALQYAGHCSGRAIALAQTSSCHAVSYPLTLWLGLPHGHACGVSLGRMLRHNAAVTAADCAHPRGPRWVRRTIHRITRELGGEPAAAAARVEGFLEACGLRRYDELEVDHRAVAAEALSYPRCHDNPRRLGDDSLSQLLATPAERGSPCGSTHSSWPTG
jgi:alcohol dehydrogenase class IV